MTYAAKAKRAIFSTQPLLIVYSNKFTPGEVSGVKPMPPP
jgi:hypothetical protein